MTTKLGTIKARDVTRETITITQGRAIIVQLSSGGRMIRFRQKGKRMWHVATVEQLFWVAVGNTAAAIKKQKAEERKARRLERKAAR